MSRAEELKGLRKTGRLQPDETVLVAVEGTLLKGPGAVKQGILFLTDERQVGFYGTAGPLGGEVCLISPAIAVEHFNKALLSFKIDMATDGRGVQSIEFHSWSEESDAELSLIWTTWQNEADRSPTHNQSGSAANPRSLGSLISLSLSLHEQGRFQEAIAAGEKAITAGANELQMLALIGHARQMLGDDESAERDLRRAVAADEPNGLAFFALGNILGGQGNWAEALPLFEQAIKLQPDMYQAIGSIGEYHMEQGDLERAEAYFRRAVGLEEGYAFGWTGLARVSVKRDDSSGAEEHARRAIAADPTLGLACGVLADLLCYRDAYDEAARVLGPALADPTEGDECRVRLAIIHLCRNDFAAAVATLGHLRMEPWPVITLIEAHAASGAGDWAQAAAKLRLLGSGSAADEPFGGTDRINSAWRHYLLGLEAATRQELPTAIRHLTEAHAKVAAAGEIWVPPFLRSIRADLEDAYRYQQEQAPARARAGGEAGSGAAPYQAADQLVQLLGRHPQFAALAEQARRIRGELDTPILVTVMGQFNAGKSTFINALIGEALAPMDVVPTTATISVLKYGAERRVRIHWRDGGTHEVESAQLRRYTVEEEGDRTELREIKYVEIFHPLPALQRINVVDTPGLNAIIPEHREVTESFQAQSDAVVWLFDARHVGKAEEKAALEKLREHARKAVGVVNQIDRIEEDDVEPVLAHVRRHFGGLVSSVIGVSSAMALAAKVGGDSTALAASNFTALERMLQDSIIAQERSIKHQATLMKLRSLIAGVEPLEEALEAQAAEHARQVEGLRESLSAFRSRAAARRHALAVSAEAAVRTAAARVARELVRVGVRSLSDADIDYNAAALARELDGLAADLAGQAARDFVAYQVNFNRQLEAAAAGTPGGLALADAWRIHFQSQLGLLEVKLQAASSYYAGLVKGGALYAAARSAGDRPTEGAIGERVLGRLAPVADDLTATLSAWEEKFFGLMEALCATLHEEGVRRLSEAQLQLFAPIHRFRAEALEPLVQSAAT